MNSSGREILSSSPSPLSIHDTPIDETEEDQVQPPYSPNENTATGRHFLILSDTFYDIMVNNPNMLAVLAKNVETQVECALLNSTKAWYLLMNRKIDRARNILRAVEIVLLDVHEPLISMAHKKVKSLLLLMTRDKIELQLLVRLTEELLERHSFSPGVSRQAGWVFLHQALANMNNKYQSLRNARAMFLQDLECQQEAKHGLDITTQTWKAFASAASRRCYARTSSHRDTAVHKFYRKQASRREYTWTFTGRTRGSTLRT